MNSTRHTSGIETGLRLILNVEQYEYMPGPHDAAGIKMLLHDSRETPSVHSLGQAVATGTHGVVGVKYLLVRKSNRFYRRRWVSWYLCDKVVCSFEQRSLAFQTFKLLI